MDRPVLIVAASGRALAAAARRGGFAPRVADWFGDEDTLALADQHRRLPRGMTTGMERNEVMDALTALADGNPGVVCGTGFEDRPELIAAIARQWPLIGNGADVVARVKDPIAVAELCRVHAIPHPDVSLQRPVDSNGWLSKRRGGAGGSHISTALDSKPGRYFQRRVPGLPVSALVLANGLRAVVLGFSEQWSSPTRRQPFRYGGAVNPAALAPAMAAALTACVQRVMKAVPLVGLNSIDFLVTGDALWLLEINPRPGATLDIFAPESGSLFALHIEACRGVLPDRVPLRRDARASAIVYADADIVRVPRVDWPHWVADRPQPGSRIRAGEPLCTVLAEGTTADAARRLVASRATSIRASVAKEAA